VPTLSLLALQPLDVDHGGLGYRCQTLAQLEAAGVPCAVRLAAVQGYLAARVDAQAEALRGRLITLGAGQSLEYQETQAQALAALAAPGTATAAAYPMLAATIGVDVDPQTDAPATDVLGVARAVQAAAARWLTAGAAIRAARLSGKAAIAAASSVEDAAAAFDAIDWP
jgi:hypothetical protein